MKSSRAPSNASSLSSGTSSSPSSIITAHSASKVLLRNSAACSADLKNFLLIKISWIR